MYYILISRKRRNAETKCVCIATDPTQPTTVYDCIVQLKTISFHNHRQCGLHVIHEKFNLSFPVNIDGIHDISLFQLI